MPRQPMAEVFGFRIDDTSSEAQRHRHQPFAYYMQDPEAHAQLDWSKQPGYPRPDYLSSSRKRLAPQLLYKGGILHKWKRKMAVAVDESFFAQLPSLPQVPIEEADVVWFVYAVRLDTVTGRYQLVRTQTVYTPFVLVLERITTAEAGAEDDFRRALQRKLNPL